MRTVTRIDDLATKVRMMKLLRLMMNRMNAHTATGWAAALLMLACVFAPAISSAQAPPPDRGVCAQVKIEILQELTFERQGFEGRMRITNNVESELTDVRVDLQVFDDNGDTPTSPVLFIQDPTVKNMTGMPDGTGVIPAGAAAELTYLMIPASYAGGTDPRGENYYIGAELYLSVNDEPTSLPVYPDDITILPQPKLDIDYFQPYEVIADDPFTLDTIEAAIPFDLGVRIRNVGWGPANKMKLESAQPKIVENEKNLLIAFRLLASYVMGDEDPNPSLTMDFGDVAEQSTVVGRWKMVSTLQGKFVSLSASYTHADELGGELTSLIEDLDYSFLVHTMLIDQPGFDNIFDFLADTDTEDDNYDPNAIFSSEGQEFPVNVVDSTTNRFPTAEDPFVELTLDNPPSGWVYTKVDDPSQGLLDLVGVTRSDGKDVLIPENSWIVGIPRHRFGEPDHVEWTFHLIDLDPTATYMLEFAPPPPDHNPPTTVEVVQEPKFGEFPLYYGTDATQFFLLPEDDVSGVANVLWSIDGSDFYPSYPLTLPDEGPHTVEFYSVDRAGNVEESKIFTFVTDLTAPTIDSFYAPTDFTPAPSVLGEDALFLTRVTATDNAIPVLDYTLEIRRGSAGVPRRADFESLPEVFSSTERLDGGRQQVLVWNGRGQNGALIPPGQYTLRLTVADPLGHSTSTMHEFTAHEPVDSVALDPTSSNQTHPSVGPSHVVWEDDRSGNSDIYGYDLETSSPLSLITWAGNQEYPRIDGDRFVFQDDSTGNYDVYMYNLTSSAITPIASGSGDQMKPDISGDYIVYQDNSSGSFDLYLRDLVGAVTTPIVTASLPQKNPRIVGDLVVFEDFRFGLSEIYVYNIGTATETRITDNLSQQSEPDIYGNRIVWTDQRNSYRDIYSMLLPGGAFDILTPDTIDQKNAAAWANYTAFTDFAAGIADPNIAALIDGVDVMLPVTLDDSEQDYVAANNRRLAWQDRRSGTWQVRVAMLDFPIADAGPDQLSSSGALVQLDGTASFDPLGDPLTYVWSQVSGTTVTLQNGDTATPTFIMPAVPETETLAMQLVVVNAKHSSPPDTVLITVRPQNDPPIADAGPDIDTFGLQTVNIDARGSSDPDDDPITAHWQVLTSPTVTLDLTKPFQPSFVAPDVTVPTTVTLRLEVKDGQYTSLPDDVHVRIAPRVNQLPIASAGFDQAVNEKTAVTLDGSSSYDPENLPISYHWIQVSGPTATLSSSSASKPTFTAPEVVTNETMRFQLTVEDEADLSAPDFVEVIVREVRQQPVAVAGDDQSVMPGDLVMLDGTASYHPDGFPIVYNWIQKIGAPVTLSDASSSTPTFTATDRRVPYTVAFDLYIADDLQPSLPDRVNIDIGTFNDPPVTDAGIDFSAYEHARVTLDGTGTTDDEGDTIYYQWTQIGGPTVELSGASTSTPTFWSPGVDTSTILTFQLITNDGDLTGSTEQVTVTILPTTPSEIMTIW
ncbi:hypothetical protein KQI84_07775 [bacterium]|nr:hypothetical protein [bacterium]